MKTKFYWVALLASAAMIAQANAGGHYGGGGGVRLCHGRAFSSSARYRFSIHLRDAVILPSDATSRPERASHRHMRRRRFANSAWLVPIARLVANLQLERPLVEFDKSRIANGRETRFTRNGNDFRNRFQTRGSNIGRRACLRPTLSGLASRLGPAQ